MWNGKTVKPVSWEMESRSCNLRVSVFLSAPSKVPEKGQSLPLKPPKVYDYNTIFTYYLVSWVFMCVLQCSGNME